MSKNPMEGRNRKALYGQPDRGGRGKSSLAMIRMRNRMQRRHKTVQQNFHDNALE